VDYFDTMSDRRALVEIKESRATRRLASNCSSKEPFQHDKNRKFFSEIRFAHLVLHRYQTSKELTHETHYPYIAVTGALLSLAFGQAQQESTDSKSEQEVEQMIEKYRAAFLRRDIPTLEKIWADNYVFINAFQARSYRPT
jgi:hypothetical protein